MGLRRRHYGNAVVAGKHRAPQGRTVEAAVTHCTAGIGIWTWSNPIG